MKRKVIQIDRDKCIGCGACASTCHQGAIQMVDGKAKLMDESHCDGLGRCLPKCPADAIHLVEKEVPAFKKPAKHQGCPSTLAKKNESANAKSFEGEVPSQLQQWPCQIKLMAPNAPYFDGANLLVAASCAGFSYGNFHDEFMKDKVTVIGCPKLDGVDYSEKLAQIIANNDIKSVTVARMNVPCCGGLTYAVNQAIQLSGKDIVPQVHIITTDGQLQG